MITATQNSILVLAFLTILTHTIHPSLLMKIIALLLLSYYIILLYINITKESTLFLLSLVVLFIYLLYRLFKGMF